MKQYKSHASVAEGLFLMGLNLFSESPTRIHKDVITGHFSGQLI